MLHYYYSSENIKIRRHINRHFTLIYLIGIIRLPLTREREKNHLYILEIADATSTSLRYLCVKPNRKETQPRTFVSC